MDMSFSIQALCLEHLAKTRGTLENRLYPVPREIDSLVASLKLASMGKSIDTLTDEQYRYLNS